VHAEGVVELLRASRREIWNEKLVGSVDRYLSANVVTHLPGGDTRHGSEEMVADVVSWLAAFPDTRVYIDEIIWSPGPGEHRASVRETIVGRHTGPSRFGPPTGRRVAVGRIVSSRIRADRIVEQWVEWDEAGLIRQLGLDERLATAELEDEDLLTTSREELPSGAGGWEHGMSASHMPHDDEHLNDADLPRAVADTVWNGRLPGAVPRYYAEDYRAQVGSRRIYGHGEIQDEILAMLAAFPDLRLHIDDIICGEARRGQLTSTRWTMLGTNSGPSAYGPPSNRSVRLTGITHHRLGDARLQEGWTQYSELSLLRRIAPPRSVAAEGRDDA
jgi:predicted ester cyclase